MAQFLRTTMDHTRTFKFTNALVPALTLTEGSIYQIQDTIGVLLLDIQYTAAGCKKAKTIGSGEEGVLVYHCEKIRVNKDAVAFLPGDAVYWNGVQGGNVTNVYSSGGIWIGICVWAAAAGDSTVIIDMKGEVGLWIRTEA
jgi:hypothetical protein